MRYFLGFLHVIEMIILLPSVIVCITIFYFSKNQNKADRIVDLLIEKRVTWTFSLIIWASGYYFIFL